MDNPFKPSLIPVCLKAKTPEELTRKMLATNALNSKMYNYQTPAKVGKEWVVWYYADVFSDKHIDGLLKEYK